MTGRVGGAVRPARGGGPAGVPPRADTQVSGCGRVRYCVVDSPPVPGLDFWLDWTLGATVEELRALLPRLAAAAGYRIDEQQSANTAPGWAMFRLWAADVPEAIGSARAQDVGDREAQLFVGPGAARDEAALADLNRLGLHLYVELLRRGLLTPPPPFELPTRPLVAPTE